jgi:hypothetical protein
MVRCDRLTILLEASPTQVGFFSTRAVDAGTVEEAVTTAFSMVRAELGSQTVDAVDELDLRVENVTQERWWWRRLRPPSGFTFFTIDPADEGRVDD